MCLPCVFSPCACAVPLASVPLLCLWPLCLCAVPLAPVPLLCLCCAFAVPLLCLCCAFVLTVCLWPLCLCCAIPVPLLCLWPLCLSCAFAVLVAPVPLLCLWPREKKNPRVIIWVLQVASARLQVTACSAWLSGASRQGWWLNKWPGYCAAPVLHGVSHPCRGKAELTELTHTRGH